MKKTVLIAGKELPIGRSFAEGASASGRNAVITAAFTGHADGTVISDSIQSFEWNKSSPVSAHSLVLQCENAFGSLDEAVLYFDEPYFLTAFSEFSLESCSQILDMLIGGYQYLSIRLLAEYETKYHLGLPAKLVFLYKTNVHGNSVAAANPLVKAAGAAFTAFAEAVAVNAGDRESVNIVLVRADSGNELVQKDSSVAAWLFGYLDTIDDLKSKLTAHQSAVWVKPGAKGPGLFTLFR